MGKIQRQTVIKSVCMPLAMAEFVQKQGLSLSGIIQGAITQMEKEANGELLESNAVLSQRILNIQETLHKAMKYIELKGGTDEFLEQKDKL